MSNETYYIPTNFTDAGRVMGLFEIRNLVEAVLLTLPVLYLCLAFVPLSLTPKIIVIVSTVEKTPKESFQCNAALQRCRPRMRSFCA